MLAVVNVNHVCLLCDCVIWLRFLKFAETDFYNTSTLARNSFDHISLNLNWKYERKLHRFAAAEEL